MSYTCLFDECGAQTLRLPSQFRIGSNRVAIERSGDGILITPVTERPSISQLFAMIDEARSEEGDLVIDRNINIPTTSREYF